MKDIFCLYWFSLFVGGFSADTRGQYYCWYLSCLRLRWVQKATLFCSLIHIGVTTADSCTHLILIFTPDTFPGAIPRGFLYPPRIKPVIFHFLSKFVNNYTCINWLSEFTVYTKDMPSKALFANSSQIRFIVQEFVFMVTLVSNVGSHLFAAAVSKH